MTTTWEYITYRLARAKRPKGFVGDFDYYRVDEILSMYKGQGWELVSAAEANTSATGAVGPTPEMVLLFKRPKNSA
jgi:hypothetical protein